MRIPSRGLLVAAVLAGPSPAAAADYSIRPDGLGDFPTIQAAVDAVLAGDTLILEDGVFTGPGNRDIQFNGKDVTVRSRNGAASCTIDSQGAPGDPHRAFRLSHGETAAARIEGLTITGGFVEGVFPENGGAGILVELATHPTITDCVFDGNEAGFQGFGGGLLAWDGCDITLTDCTFQNGESGWYGGGFVLRKNCDATVERVLVQNNHSIHAGGGASITNSDASVTDCVFIGNSTDEADGGGLLVKAGALPVLTRCVFLNNSAVVGGALGLGNDPVVTAVNCLFAGNSATSGGAICLDQCPSTANFINCTFTRNTATLSGRHIRNSFNASTTLRNCILTDACGTGVLSIVNDITGTVDIDCSLIEGGAATVFGAGTLIYGPGNVDAAPLFCAPDPCGVPAAPGDYSLDSMSPAAGSWNSCGLVGAYDVACGATSAGHAVEATSWGRVKAGFRAPPR